MPLPSWSAHQQVMIHRPWSLTCCLTDQREDELYVQEDLPDGPEQANEAPTLLDTTPRRRIARHALTLSQTDTTGAPRHAGLHSGKASRHLSMDGPSLSGQRQPPMALQHPGLVQASWNGMPHPMQPMQPIPQMISLGLSCATGEDAGLGLHSNAAGDGAGIMSRRSPAADSSKHAEPCKLGLHPYQAGTDVVSASTGRRSLQDDAESGKEQLPSVREAAEEAEEQLEHPCLQQGFSRPYALRHRDPALPSLITLVGR